MEIGAWKMETEPFIRTESQSESSLNAEVGVAENSGSHIV